MAEKFPYLARQINGPIAEYFGKGIDSVYENDADFIDFLSRFSIDNLEGKWLDALGLLLGLPRPWVEVPMIQEALLFDNIPAIVPNPISHPIFVRNKCNSILFRTTEQFNYICNSIDRMSFLNHTSTLKIFSVYWV